MEGCADRQPWCGGDAAQAQKGALSSRERRKRKRKRKEVGRTLIEAEQPFLLFAVPSKA